MAIFRRIVGALLFNLFRTQIQAAITSILSNALGRSIPANKAAKVAFGQLFSNIPNGGLLGQLAGAGTNAAEQPTNIMEDMAMNVRMTNFINFCPTYYLR